MMNRQEKEQEVKILKNHLEANQAMFLVNIQGLKVAQLHDLRKELYKENGKLRVTKNTLAKIAIKDFPDLEKLAPSFKKQLAMIFAPKEAQNIAKIINAKAKENENLDIVAGCFESKFIDQDMIKFLATIPERPVLLAQLCNVIQGPIRGPINIMHQILSRLIYVVKQLAEKR